MYMDGIRKNKAKLRLKMVRGIAREESIFSFLNKENKWQTTRKILR